MMIRLLSILLYLEEMVEAGAGKKAEDEAIINEKYKVIKVAYDKAKKKVKLPKMSARMSAGIDNVKNIIRNGFDNTIGYGIAKAQNYQTKRELKKNPGSDKKIVYLMHGLFQDEGSQWRYGSELRRRGYNVYHLKGHHSLEREANVDKAFEQIDGLHKYTKLKDPSTRYDAFSGHSSGADVGIAMASDPRVSKYGIREVQARAPAPSGIEARTIGQRLLMPFASEDNTKKSINARRNVVKMTENKPIVPVYVVAGRYDGLVQAKDALYAHAKQHYLIDHPESTHFGTSGVNDTMNRTMASLLNPVVRDYYARAGTNN